jgi:hypothetical protein
MRWRAPFRPGQRGLSPAAPWPACAHSVSTCTNTTTVLVLRCRWPEYDPDDPDWACNEVFAYREPLFELPRAAVGGSWEEGLSAALDLVRRYLRSRSPDHPLRLSSVVAVGWLQQGSKFWKWHLPHQSARCHGGSGGGGRRTMQRTRPALRVGASPLISVFDGPRTRWHE